MSHITPQSGLAKRRLGTVSLLFFTVSASAPMTVLAGGIIAAYAVTGSIGVPLVFPILALSLALFVVGYAAMSRYVSNAGAFYAYLAQGLGRAWGVAGSFVALVAYNTINLGLYGLFGAVFGGWMLEKFDVDMNWWVWSFAVLAVVGLLGILRVDLNAKVLAVLLIAEVIAVIVFDVAAIGNPADGLTIDGFLPADLFGAAAAGWCLRIRYRLLRWLRVRRHLQRGGPGSPSYRRPGHLRRPAHHGFPVRGLGVGTAHGAWAGRGSGCHS